MTVGFQPEALRRLRHALERIGATASWPEQLGQATASVAAALDELPARWKTIVLRCDLGRELHRAVAADLGISKRHLYRERVKALRALAVRLGVPTLPPAMTAIPAVDADVAIAGVLNSLFDTRAISRAVPVLEAAIRDVVRPPSRIRLLIKLCGVYCQLGVLARAASALALAYQTFEAAQFDHQQAHTLRLELAVEASSFLRYQQDPSAAEQRLLQAIRYCITVGLSGVAVNRALAGAQLALANLLGTRDRYVEAVAYASEADRILREYQFDMPLRSRAMTQLATMRFFGGVTPAQIVLHDLKAAYSVAQTNGLAVDMVQSATVLAFLHSFAGDHETAIAYGRSVVEVATAASLRDPFVTGAHYTLGSAQVGAGALARATRSLNRVQQSQTRHPESGFPFTRFLEAQVLSVGGQYQSALRVAQGAIGDLELSHNVRTQGAALELRAAVEEKLGEQRRARESVDSAIALLERGAPAGLLGRAYARSARLTGNVRHRTAALELRASAVVS